MAYEKGNRPDSPMKRRGGRRRKKVCVFCGKENNEIDYKDVAKLKNMFLKEERSSQEESQETVQNIRELLQWRSREQDISL